MKELENNKSNMILTSLYKTLIYLCWFLFGVTSYCIIDDTITNFDVFLLIIFLMSFYSLRTYFKYLYKNIASVNYRNIKQGIELHYYDLCTKLSYNDLIKESTSNLDNKILNVSYRYTKMIKDIGECFIPLALGLIILFILLVRTSVLLFLFVLVALSLFIWIDFKSKKADTNYSNNNFLLEDLLHKLFTIKVLNLSSYFKGKLDENIVNNNVNFKNEEFEDNIIFNIYLMGLLIFILLFIFIKVSSSINKLTLIFAILIIAYKLQILLNNLVPAIKNIISVNKDKIELDLMFINIEDINYRKEFDNVKVQNGLIKYESGIQIKIPNFELKNSDTVSIMGKSGQGKSTIVNVLSGINNLSDGNILINDEATNDVLDGVYIGKMADIFKISLRDNLKLYKDISDDEILSLLKEVGLLNWYNELSNGLDTILDFNISSDTLLRISLVRGKILDKSIYFFDFDALGTDIDSEKMIVNFIKKNLKKKTYIIVTHSAVITNICKKHYFIKDHTLLESEPLL